MCAACYGADLATGKLANVGAAVGVTAAHAVGAPAIQLTLRTFYGPRRPADRIPGKGGLPRAAELERSGAEIEPEELVRSFTSIFREQGVRIHDKHFEVIARCLHRPPQQGFLTRAACPLEGESQIGILAEAALRGETDRSLGKRIPTGA